LGSLADGCDKDKSYPYYISRQRKNFLVLSAKNPITKNRYEDVVEDNENEKCFDEF